MGQIRNGFFIFLIYMSSCKPEACEEMNCIPGAICIEGKCIDHLPGKYHVIGTNISYIISDTTKIITQIDDTMSIERVNDSSIVFEGKTLFQSNSCYYCTNNLDRINYNGFNDRYIGHTTELRFKINFDDSIFYYSPPASLGGGTITNLKGIKIQ